MRQFVAESPVATGCVHFTVENDSSADDIALDLVKPLITDLDVVFSGKFLYEFDFRLRRYDSNASR